MRISILILVCLIVGAVIIGWGCIWGWGVNKVVKNKGYDENWFWWGFFFGIIALIVALTKPQNIYNQKKEPFDELKKYKELMDSGIITEEEFNKKKLELLGL